MDAITSFFNWLVSAPFYCLFWIVIGFIAGALARRIVGARDASFVADVVLGIIGAWVGGFIVGLFRPGGLDIGCGIGSFVTALVGAIVLIMLGRVITGGMRRS